jgi:hypothetical protein
MRPNRASLCILGTALAVLSCSQEKATPVGSALYDQENPGSENRLVVPASRDTVYTQSVSCGSGYSLFTGSQGGVETRAFVVFDTVTVGGSVERAVLAFRTFPYAGSASGDVRLLVSETQSDWDEYSLTWDTRPAETGPPFAESTAAASDTSDVEIEIPLDLALSLVNPDTSAVRPGVALLAGDPDCVFRLYSREAGVTLSPVLLFIAAGDTADTLTVRTRKDAFVVRNETGLPVERLRMQNGTAERILLFFDVSAIPREATINRARLILHTDEDHVFPASEPDFPFYAYDSPGCAGLDPRGQRCLLRRFDRYIAHIHRSEMDLRHHGERGADAEGSAGNLRSGRVFPVFQFRSGQRPDTPIGTVLFSAAHVTVLEHR